MKTKPPNFEEMMKDMDISGLGFNFIDMVKNMGNDKSGIFGDKSGCDMSDNIFNDFSGNSKNIPNPDDLQDHLKSLMGGKIGQLAQEIANDIISISESFNVDAKIIGRVEANNTKKLTIKSQYGEFIY